jgi:PAS domain S-box-containing protein
MRKILLVEDEAIIAMAETAVLEAEGYEVIRAATGEAAVRAALDGASRVDLVLMDINLGEGIDGTEAARRILAARDVPILFLSSHTEPEIVAMTEEIGSYGYVAKNSGTMVLAASIRMAFKLENANRALKESERRYRNLFEAMGEGFALHEAIRDGSGRMVDYRFLAMNPAFERMTGLESSGSVGKTVLELLPGIERAWIEAYEKVVDSGSPATLRMEAAALGKVYQVNAFKAEPERFAVFVRDVSGEERAYAELKSREEELEREKRDSDERRAILDSAIDQTGSMYLVIDGDWRFRMVNATYCDYQGLPKESIVGRSVLDVVGTEAWERVRPYAERAFSGERVCFRAWRDFPAKGHRELTVSYDPVRTEDGTIGFVAATLVDVTEEEARDRELRRLEVASKLLVQFASEGIALAGPDGMPVIWNDALEKLTGVSHDDVMGKPIWEAIAGLRSDGDSADVVEDASRKLLEASFKALLDPGSSFPNDALLRTSEVQVFGPDGYARWLEEHIFRFLAESTPYAGAIVRDVTDRHLIESRLTESEERFRLAMDATNDGIWDWDLNKGRIFRNRSYWRMLGYDGREFLDDFDAWERLLHPDDREMAVEANRATIRGEAEGFAIEFRMRTAGGKWKWILGRTKVAYRDANGRAVRLVGTHTDIDSLKEAQLSLERAVADKIVLMRELQHRVKNNLSVVSSLLSIEKDRTVDERSRDVLVDSMARVGTIRKLYDLLYKGDEMGSIDLGAYLAEVVRGAIDAFPDSKIRFEPALESVRLDVRRAVPVGLIANELVTNSVKYAWPSSEGGILRVSLAQVGGRVSLSIADDGAGCAREPDSGTGLRLVRMLAEQIEGELEMRFERGVSVTLAFPLAQDTAG